MSPLRALQVVESAILTVVMRIAAHRLGRHVEGLTPAHAIAA
jgi:hypothetical protein